MVFKNDITKRLLDILSGILEPLRHCLPIGHGLSITQRRQKLVLYGWKKFLVIRMVCGFPKFSFTQQNLVL